MIESTNLKMLRNLEAFQVFSDILAFLQEEESVEEPLQGLCDAFAARLSDYDTALVPERRSRYTAELARLDGQRDYVFRSLIAHLKLYLSSFDAVQVKAAEALLALADKYGRNIPAMPYRQETGAIKNLLQDLDLEANAAHTQTLFAGHWVSALRTANEQFEQMMLTRSDAASEAEAGGAKAAREAVQAAFEKLCGMINALAIVNGDAAYKHTIDRINQLVSESHNVAARRRFRKKSNDVTIPDSSADIPDTPDSLPVEE